MTHACFSGWAEGCLRRVVQPTACVCGEIFHGAAFELPRKGQRDRCAGKPAGCDFSLRGGDEPVETGP
jgi:hypothetical protein